MLIFSIFFVNRVEEVVVIRRRRTLSSSTIIHLDDQRMMVVNGNRTIQRRGETTIALRRVAIRVAGTASMQDTKRKLPRLDMVGWILIGAMPTMRGITEIVPSMEDEAPRNRRDTIRPTIVVPIKCFANFFGFSAFMIHVFCYALAGCQSVCLCLFRQNIFPLILGF
jgi:hypothetical protein